MVLLYGGYYFRQGQKFKGYFKWENIAIGFVCISILAVAATPNQPLTHINRESPVVPPTFLPPICLRKALSTRQ